MTRPLLSIAAPFSALALDDVLAQQRYVRVPTPPCRPRTKDGVKEEGLRASVLPTPSCSWPHASGPWCTTRPVAYNHTVYQQLDAAGYQYIAPYVDSPACPCGYRSPNRGRYKTSAEI
jgi:hypothetical protein